MREKSPRLIVTFHTTAGAIATEQLCRRLGLEGKLISVPRCITSDCGMAWSAPPELREHLETRLQEAGIDLVLMDMPWLPREGRYPKYDDYRAVLAKTASESGVPVFPRYGMMKSWSGSKQFSEEEIVGMDGLQVVESGYRCLGIRLADGIVAELGEGREPGKPTN